jgi:hypothetical protein
MRRSAQLLTVPDALGSSGLLQLSHKKCGKYQSNATAAMHIRKMTIARKLVRMRDPPKSGWKQNVCPYP